MLFRASSKKGPLTMVLLAATVTAITTLLPTALAGQTTCSPIEKEFVFFDRHHVHCPHAHALTRWRLANNGCNGHDNGRVNYTCERRPAGDWFQKKTGCQTSGHSSAYLDRHNVDCGSGNILTGFRLHTCNNNGGVYFHYTCTKIADNGPVCKDLETQCTDAGNSLVYLDRHNVKCPADSFLSSFKMTGDGCGGSDKKIKYRCCKEVKGGLIKYTGQGEGKKDMCLDANPDDGELYLNDDCNNKNTNQLFWYDQDTRELRLVHHLNRGCVDYHPDNNNLYMNKACHGGNNQKFYRFWDRITMEHDNFSKFLTVGTINENGDADLSMKSKQDDGQDSFEMHWMTETQGCATIYEDKDYSGKKRVFCVVGYRKEKYDLTKMGWNDKITSIMIMEPSMGKERDWLSAAEPKPAVTLYQHQFSGHDALLRSSESDLGALNMERGVTWNDQATSLIIQPRQTLGRRDCWFTILDDDGKYGILGGKNHDHTRHCKNDFGKGEHCKMGKEQLNTDLTNDVFEFKNGPCACEIQFWSDDMKDLLRDGKRHESMPKNLGKSYKWPTVYLEPYRTYNDQTWLSRTEYTIGDCYTSFVPWWHRNPWN